MGRGLIVFLSLALSSGAVHAISNDEILACWQGAPDAEATMAACDRIIADPTVKTHDLAWTYEHRAKLQSFKSRYVEALADIDRAIALSPGFTKYRDRASYLFMLNDYERGVPAYDLLIGLEPNEPSHRDRRAILLRDMKNAQAGKTQAPAAAAAPTEAAPPPVAATAPKVLAPVAATAPAPEAPAPVANPPPTPAAPVVGTVERSQSPPPNALPERRITAAKKKATQKTDCTAYVAAVDATIAVPCPK